MTRAWRSVFELFRRRSNCIRQSTALAGNHFRFQHPGDARLVGGPCLQKLRLHRELDHRDSIAGEKIIDYPHRDIAGQIRVFQSQLVTDIKQEQNIRRQMLDAFDLLLLAVFQHQHVINRERRIIMAIDVSRGDWKADFFREDLDGFLVFASWGGRGRRSRTTLRAGIYC